MKPPPRSELLIAMLNYVQRQATLRRAMRRENSAYDAEVSEGLNEKPPADLTNEELNAAIAREVMGWVLRIPNHAIWREECWCREDGTFARVVANWSPATSRATAFEVVERMREIDPTTFVVIRSPNHRNPQGWSCHLWMLDQPNGINELTAKARADTLPRAICEAALLALYLFGRGCGNNASKRSR